MGRVIKPTAEFEEKPQERIPEPEKRALAGEAAGERFEREEAPGRVEVDETPPDPGKRGATWAKKVKMTAKKTNAFCKHLLSSYCSPC